MPAAEERVQIRQLAHERRRASDRVCATLVVRVEWLFSFCHAGSHASNCREPRGDDDGQSQRLQETGKAISVRGSKSTTYSTLSLYKPSVPRKAKDSSLLSHAFHEYLMIFEDGGQRVSLGIGVIAGSKAESGSESSTLVDNSKYGVLVKLTPAFCRNPANRKLPPAPARKHQK